MTVDGRLRLGIGELGVGAHQDAVEAVAALHPVGADGHAHGQRRPVLALAQRAEVVRDALGQHRHHPVGEVDRIAPQHRLAVEGRARPDIGRHVGDRDGDDEAALVGRIGIGLGHHRIVVVLGVGRVDRDQRRLTPILATALGRPLGLVGLRQHVLGEDVRNVVDVQGDQTDRLLRAERAEALGHPAAGQAEAGLALDCDADEVSVAGLALLAGRDRDLLALRPLLHRQEATAVAAGAIDADHLRAVLADHLDDAAGIAARRLRVRRDADQGPVAEAGGRSVALAPAAGQLDDDPGRFALPIPLGRTGHEVAVPIPGGNVGQHDGGQAAALAETAAAAIQRPLLLDLLQDRLEPDLVGALQAEGLGDLALADRSGRVGDEGEDLLAGGKNGRTRLRIDASGQGQGSPRRSETGPARRIFRCGRDR